MFLLGNLLFILFGIVSFILKRKYNDMFYRYYPILLLAWTIIGLYFKFNFITLLGPVFITAFEYKRINNNHVGILLITVGLFFIFTIFGIDKIISLYLISLILINYFIISLYKNVIAILLLSLLFVFSNSLFKFSSIETRVLLYETFSLYLLIALFIYIYTMMAKILKRKDILK
jgi:hypothetical protein